MAEGILVLAGGNGPHSLEHKPSDLESESKIARVEAAIFLPALAKWVTQIAADLEVELASKDVPILGGAIAGKATHLLTGDEKAFGGFWGKTVQAVKIVSPRTLADELVKRGWI